MLISVILGIMKRALEALIISSEGGGVEVEGSGGARGCFRIAIAPPRNVCVLKKKKLFLIKLEKLFIISMLVKQTHFLPKT